MHLHRRQLRENVRHAVQFGPVVLDVLAGAEVRVVVVVFTCNVRKHAHLLGVYETIRNRHAQHRRMLLHVEAVLQADGLKFLAAEFAGNKAFGLVAELRDALVNDGLVKCGVLIHASIVKPSLRR